MAMFVDLIEGQQLVGEAELDELAPPIMANTSIHLSSDQ